MRHPPDLSIVIPCYRQRARLTSTDRPVQQTMSFAEAPFEVIFAEDGSPDGTWNVLQGLARSIRSSEA